MRPIRGEVRDVLLEHALQVPLVEHEHVVQSPTTEGPDHPLGEGDGPRRPEERQQGIDPERPLGGFLALRGKIEVDLKWVVRTGDLAPVSNAWTLTGTGPDGAPVTLTGQMADVVRRRPDGARRYSVATRTGRPVCADSTAAIAVAKLTQLSSRSLGWGRPSRWAAIRARTICIVELWALPGPPTVSRGLSYET